MEAVAIVSIVAAGLTVAVLAAYLIALALILRRVNARLRAVTFAMRELAPKVAPFAHAVEAVNLELDQLSESLRRFLLRERMRP